MEFLKLNIQLFGASGSDTATVKSLSGNKGTVYVEYSEADATGDYITNNRTKITYKGTFTQNTGSYAQYSSPRFIVTWYDNNKNAQGKELYNKQISAMNRYDVITASGSFDVDHLDDGKLRGFIVATWKYDGTGQHACQTGSAETTFQDMYTIPRKSSCYASDTYIGSTATINITRYSSAFRHVINWSCGSASGNIDVPAGNVSAPLELDKQTFYTQIPNAEYATVSIKCHTYNGDSLIGTSDTKTFKALKVDNDCKPTVDIAVTSDNAKTEELTGDTTDRTVIYNYSDPVCKITITPKYGASIKTLTLNGVSIPVNTTSYTIQNTTTNEYTIVATDSRNATNSDKDTLTKVSYIKPTFTSATLFKRNTAVDGKVNVTYKGTVFNGNFGKVNNPDNIKVYYCWKEKNTSTYSSWIELPKPTLSGNTFENTYQLPLTFNYDKAYSFKLTVVDSLYGQGTILYTQDVGKGKPVYWWDENGLYVEGDLKQYNSSKSAYQNVGISLEDVYPIGSVYFNASKTTNPQELLGFGTWVRIGEGQYFIGLTTSDTLFNTAGKTGGSWSQSFTLPTHRHQEGNHRHALSDVGYAKIFFGSASFQAKDFSTASWSGNAKKTVSGSTSSSTFSATYGVGLGGYTDNMRTTSNANETVYTGYSGDLTTTAKNIVLPYCTLVAWKRTA